MHAEWLWRGLLTVSLLLFAGGTLAANDIRLTDVTDAVGLREPLAGLMGHGVAWGDFDGDGRVDLFVGGFCDRPDDEYAPSPGPVPTRLLRQTPDGRFESVVQPPANVFGRTSGAVFADFDNDGRLELYVGHNAKPGGKPTGDPTGPQARAKRQASQFFHNVEGVLREVTMSSGACPPELGTVRNIAPFDVDGDGWLDLFVVEDRFRKGPRSRLFRNRGNMTFDDATTDFGLPDDLFGLGHAVGDVNNDGYPDLFVGHSNRLFLGGPDGRFTEPALLRECFAWQPLHGEDWPCGAAFGDLNRDGLLDLVLSIHCETARNRVYLNEGVRDGVPRFRDVTAEVGLPDSIPVKCPHVEIQDFDNDGWPDLYFSAAWRDADGTITPLIFRHQGLIDGLPRFVAPRPIAPPMMYYPCGPSCDYDRDGDLDLFLVNWFAGDHCHLLRNDTPRGNWLQIVVEGRTFNRQGLGTQLTVYEPGEPGRLIGRQDLHIGTGYAGGHEAVCHFGLGTATHVDLAIRWPNGIRAERRRVAANQRLVLRETSE
jgi:enediyne biosynthesis protein E4